jgi:formate C-acetyltransferase
LRRVFGRSEDGKHHNPARGAAYVYRSEDYENLASSRLLEGRTYNDIAAAWQPKGYEELCRMQVSATVKGTPLLMMPAGHLTPGFKKIIDVGYGAIQKQAQDWLDSHVNNLMGDDVNRSLFYTAAVISCDAATILLKRYSEVQKNSFMRRRGARLWSPWQTALSGFQKNLAAPSAKPARRRSPISIFCV